MAISERIKKAFMGNRKLDIKKIEHIRERFERFRKKGQRAIAKVQKFATEMEQRQSAEKKKKNQNSMTGIFDV